MRIITAATCILLAIGSASCQVLQIEGRSRVWYCEPVPGRPELTNCNSNLYGNHIYFRMETFEGRVDIDAFLKEGLSNEDIETISKDFGGQYVWYRAKEPGYFASKGWQSSGDWVAEPLNRN